MQIKSAGVSKWLVLLIGVLTFERGFAAVGRVPGQADVAATGEATYTIPIQVPPGINGLTPELALEYGHRKGESIAGRGWALSGLSVITRCPKNIAQDGTTDSINLATNDQLCVDGVRLQIVTGTQGLAGSTYRTEIDNVTHYQAYSGAGAGPAYFIARAKNGLTYEYGNTTDSRIEALVGSNTTARAWALSKISDRNGNNIAFKYLEDGAPYGDYRIDYITYRSNAGQGVSTVYKVDFTYENQNDADNNDNEQMGGAKVEDIWRLNHVDVLYTGVSPATLIRQYELTYDASLSSASRSRLATVKECAGSPLDCLAPTTFAYQNGANTFDAAVSSGSTIPATATPRAMDINGDGRTDLAYPDPATNGKWYFQLAQANGTYGNNLNSNIPNTNHAKAIVIDYNHDGLDDLLIPSGTTWYAYLGTTNGLTSAGATNTNAPAVSEAGNATALDMNGDGRDDLVWGENVGAVANSRVLVRYRNTGAGFSSTPTVLYDGQSGNKQLLGPTLFSGSFKQGRGNVFDADGDGLADIAIVTKRETFGGPGEPSEIFYWTDVILGGGGVFNIHTNVAQGLPIDINGDGYTDVAFWGAGVQFRLSTGNAFGPIINGPSLTNFFVGAAVATDWNGDGMQDLLIPKTTDGKWYFFRSKGDTFAAPVSTETLTEGVLAAFRTDSNGDGLDDVGFMTSGRVYKHLPHAGPTPDLLQTVTDGNGNTTTFGYVSIAEGDGSYTKGTGAAFPEQNYAKPVTVVKTATTSTAVGSGTYTLTYEYKDAQYNLQGRGLSPFGERIITDSRNGTQVHEYYHKLFPYRGRLLRDTVQQADDTVIQDTDYAWSTKTFGTGYKKYYLPYVAVVDEKQYEVGGPYNGAFLSQVATTTAVDNYGTPTSIQRVSTEQGTANGLQAGDSYTESVVNTGIINDTTNWCLGQVGTTQWVNSHSDIYGAQITRTVDRTWDIGQKCRIQSEITEPLSSTNKVTRAIGYDAFGNVNSETVTGINMPARITSINWGTTGQFPTTVTNAEGHVTSTQWNVAKGVPNSTTDPNGLVVAWQYDAFGRRTRETTPDGTYVQFALANCTSSGSYCSTGNSNVRTEVKQTLHDTAGVQVRADVVYLDKRDRIGQTKSQTLTGAYSYTRTIYDAFGRLSQQSMPSFSTAPAYYATTTYDLAHRPIQISRPKSAGDPSVQSTTISYLGQTVEIEDALQKTAVQVFDVLGRVYRSTDHGGYYQQFEYDAFGSLRRVRDNNDTLFQATYAYGAAAFKLTSSDMDLGAWSYTPNALGEVVAHTDAKGQNFTATYDKLSRPKKRTEPGLTTDWVWGNSAAAKNIGRLGSISVAGHSEVYVYDSLGRLSQKTTTADAVAYVENYGYHSQTGLLDSMRYPTSTSGYRLKLKYDYQYGLLHKVSDFDASTTVFWEAQDVDARGNVIHESLGSALESIRMYDEVTGLIDYAVGGPNANGFRQNLEFKWNEVGNLIERKDLKRSRTENYYYDNLHRLDYSTNNGVQNLDLSYAMNGNILSKSDVGSGTWTYHATKKHAVIATPGNTFNYDANGNQTVRNGNTVSWSSYNYPTSIAHGSGKSHAYSYSGHRKRWKTVYNNGSTSETTISVGQQLLDKRTEGSFTEYRHYINVGDRTVASYTRPSTGSPSTKYMLYDHQGSVDAVTNDVGGNYLSESFAAFGERRDAFDWTGPPPAGDLTLIDQTLDRGYTSQTHLEGSSLIHMNGRVLDAKLGRFLSADPYVPHPSSTQSFNRYSYVQNNPLSRVDPSGFLDLDAPLRPDPRDVYNPRDEQMPGDSYRDYGDTSRNESGGQSPGSSNRGSRPRSEGLEFGCATHCGNAVTALDAVPTSDTSPAPMLVPNSQIDENHISVVVGIDSTVGGNPFPIGGPFTGGGTSVGINSAGQVFARFSAKGEAGIWAYFGVSAFGSVGTSQKALPIGVSQQTVAIGEGNIGFGPSIGGSVTTDGSGLSISRSLRAGAGYGGALSAGLQRDIYIASPPLVPHFISGAGYIAGGINSGAQVLTDYSLRLSGQLIGLGNTIGGWFGAEQ